MQNEKFCGGCGTAVLEEKKFTNKHVGMIVCLLVAIVAILGLLALFSAVSGRDSGPEGAKRVLEQFLEAFRDVDIYSMSRYMAVDFEILMIDNLEAQDLSEAEINEMIREEFDSLSELLDEELRHEFGRNYRISFEILDYIELTQREVNFQIEQLEDEMSRMGFDPDYIEPLNQITEMIEFNVEIGIYGSQDEEWSTERIIVARIGRNWLVLSLDIFF